MAVLTTGRRVFNPTCDNSWIVCSITTLEEARIAAQQGADAVEFRCDLAPEKYANPSLTIQQIRESITLPIVGTIRKEGDGGSWSHNDPVSESARLHEFEKIIHFIDAVDIEVDSKINKAVVALARRNYVKIITSYHNFFSMENKDKIGNRMEEATATGGDIIKLAYINRSEEDILLLFKILKEYHHRMPLALIGMGSIGTATRIVFPCFGSCITYGYIEGPESCPYAPGQISIKELRRRMRDVQVMKQVGMLHSDEAIMEFLLHYEFNYSAV